MKPKLSKRPTLRTHGGARAGAGRKPASPEMIYAEPFSVRFPQTVLDEITTIAKQATKMGDAMFGAGGLSVSRNATIVFMVRQGIAEYRKFVEKCPFSCPHRGGQSPRVRPGLVA